MTITAIQKSKSEMLLDLLKEAQIISDEMKRLFKKNNVPHAHVQLLPKKDYKQWQRLFKIDHRLNREMCNIFKPKKL